MLNKSSGHTKTLTYNKHRQTTRPRRTQQRNIIWDNPPFSNNVQTNICKTFLRLVSKHFPKHHKYQFIQQEQCKCQLQLYGEHGIDYQKT